MKSIKYFIAPVLMVMLLVTSCQREELLPNSPLKIIEDGGADNEETGTISKDTSGVDFSEINLSGVNFNMVLPASYSGDAGRDQFIREFVRYIFSDEINAASKLSNFSISVDEGIMVVRKFIPADGAEAPCPKESKMCCTENCGENILREILGQGRDVTIWVDFGVCATITWQFQDC